MLVRELLERANGGVTYTPEFFNERCAKVRCGDVDGDGCVDVDFAVVFVFD